MNRKLKLLLLFSGQVRPINPDVFNKSLNLFIGDNTADISLDYWESPGISMAHQPSKRLISDMKVDNYIEKAFKNFKVVHKNKHSQKTLSKYPIQSKIHNSNHYLDQTKHSVLQLLQIYLSVNSIKNIHEYDIVIRCRYDSCFLFPFKNNHIEDNTIYNINFGNAFYKNRIYDIFFYGRPNSMWKVCQTFENLEQLINDPFDNGLDKRDACRLLYLSAIKSGLSIKTSDWRYTDIKRDESLPVYIGTVSFYGLSTSIFKYSLKNLRLIISISKGHGVLKTLGIYIFRTLRRMFGDLKRFLKDY